MLVCSAFTNHRPGPMEPLPAQPETVESSSEWCSGPNPATSAPCRGARGLRCEVYLFCRPDRSAAIAESLRAAAQVQRQRSGDRGPRDQQPQYFAGVFTKQFARVAGLHLVCLFVFHGYHVHT